MKKRINEFLTSTRDEIEYRLRRMCGELTPQKWLIIILFVCLFFGIGSIYTTVSSIYHIGRSDAEREFMELQHTCTEYNRSIETLRLQNDSIEPIKN